MMSWYSRSRNATMDLTSIREQLKGSFPDLMGIQFLEASPGRVTASLVARPDLCTVGNILHGGAIMAFADTLGAVATAVNLTTGSTTTIESKTNFLKAVPINSQILGECTPLHRGSRTMVWQTRITFDDGKLIALVIQ